MANRERGEMTLAIGTDRYVLRLTTNACCELEDFTNGKKTWDQIWDGMRVGSQRDVRLFLWVALREHHPDIATTDPACLKTIGLLIDRAGGATLLLVQLRALMLLNLETYRAEESEGADASDARPRKARARTGAARTSRPSLPA